MHPVTETPHDIHIARRSPAATYRIFSDLHAQIWPLTLTLGNIPPGESSIFCFGGDNSDRGPFTVPLFHLVSHLQNISTLGNHEAAFASWVVESAYQVQQALRTSQSAFFDTLDEIDDTIERFFQKHLHNPADAYSEESLDAMSQEDLPGVISRTLRHSGSSSSTATPLSTITPPRGIIYTTKYSFSDVRRQMEHVRTNWTNFLYGLRNLENISEYRALLHRRFGLDKYKTYVTSFTENTGANWVIDADPRELDLMLRVFVQQPTIALVEDEASPTRSFALVHSAFLPRSWNVLRSRQNAYLTPEENWNALWMRNPTTIHHSGMEGIVCGGHSPRADAISANSINIDCETYRTGRAASLISGPDGVWQIDLLENPDPDQLPPIEPWLYLKQLQLLQHFQPHRNFLSPPFWQQLAAGENILVRWLQVEIKALWPKLSKYQQYLHANLDRSHFFSIVNDVFATGYSPLNYLDQLISAARPLYRYSQEEEHSQQQNHSLLLNFHSVFYGCKLLQASLNYYYHLFQNPVDALRPKFFYPRLANYRARAEYTAILAQFTYIETKLTELSQAMQQHAGPADNPAPQVVFASLHTRIYELLHQMPQPKQEGGGCVLI